MSMKRFRRRVAAFFVGLTASALVFAGLETGTYISDLVATNPLSSDLASTADDHLRLIKSTIKTTFPNINGAVSATDEQLSQLGTNVFTATPFELENAAWRILLDETDASTNERLWDVLAVSGTLFSRTRTNGDATGNTWLSVDRTGTTIDSIALASTALTWNGNTLFTTANDGASSGLDADLLDGVQGSDYARISQANTFTADQTINSQLLVTGPGSEYSVQLQNATPNVRLVESDASTDNGRWGVEANAEQFFIQTINDAESAATKAITIDRTGTTVDTINLLATTVQTNGFEILQHAATRVSSAGSLAGTGYNVTSAVNNSTGQYTVDYTAAGFGSAPVCTATLTAASGEIQLAVPSSTSVNVSTYDSSGTLTDKGFSLSCTGT